MNNPFGLKTYHIDSKLPTPTSPNPNSILEEAIQIFTIKNAAQALLEKENLYISDQFHKKRLNRLMEFMKEHGIEKVKVTTSRNHDHPNKVASLLTYRNIGRKAEHQQDIWAVIENPKYIE